MRMIDRNHARVLALFVVAGAIGAAVVSTPCFSDEPVREEAPDDRPPPPPPRPVPKPAVERTAVRFRLALPDGSDAEAHVRAWWRGNASDAGMLHQVIRHGDHLTVVVPPGPGIVTIHVAGCVVVRRAVDAKAGTTTDTGVLALRRCALLRGRVIGESGAPVEDATLWPKAGDLSVPLTVTDEKGTFSFDGLPDGSIRLRVESDHFVRKTVFVQNGKDADLAEIVLQRGGELRGVVLDEKKRPAPGAYLWVLDPHDEKNRDRMAWPDVAEDGTFAVRLASGRYRVGARTDERTGSLIVDVKDGKTSEATLIVSR